MPPNVTPSRSQGGESGLLWRWRIAITESSLPPLARLVAWTLSRHMNADGGSCWPSLDLLADETGMSRRSVHQYVHVLKDAGWLVVGERNGRRGKLNTYTATLPLSAQESMTQAQTMQDTSGLSANDDTTQCTPCTGGSHEEDKSSTQRAADLLTGVGHEASRLAADLAVAAQPEGSIRHKPAFWVSARDRWIEANAHLVAEIDDGTYTAEALLAEIERLQKQKAKKKREPIRVLCDLCKGNHLLEMGDGSWIQCECVTGRRRTA